MNNYTFSFLDDAANSNTGAVNIQSEVVKLSTSSTLVGRAINLDKEEAADLAIHILKEVYPGRLAKHSYIIKLTNSAYIRAVNNNIPEICQNPDRAYKYPSKHVAEPIAKLYGGEPIIWFD